MNTQDQIDILESRMRSCQRICTDYTGPGIGFGDLAVKRFSEYKPESHKLQGKVELCNMTLPLIQSIYPNLRVRFENRTIRIPTNKDLREDLHAVHQKITKTGKISYGAPHSDEADGAVHSDRCCAAALCVRAASDGAGNFSFSKVRKPPRGGARMRGLFGRN